MKISSELQAYFLALYAFIATIGRRSTPRTFQIRIANDEANDIYSLFDAFGAVSDANKAQNTTDANITMDFKGGIAGFRRLISSTPVYISEIKYQAESGSTQHNRAFVYKEGDIDGTLVEKPLTAFISSQKDQYRLNDTEVNVKVPLELNGYCDILVDVLAEENVSLTFTVAEIQRLH